jgi:hypothetical protein
MVSNKKGLSKVAKSSGVYLAREKPYSYSGLGTAADI